MNQGLLKVLAGAAIIALIVCLIMAILATIGGVKITDGCFQRYSMDGQKKVSADSITNTITLRADSNYTSTSGTDSDGKAIITKDPLHYGEWLNSNLTVSSGQIIKLRVKGEVSLCKAYLPKNNLGSSSNLDKNNQKIAIPRVEDEEATPLIFSATLGEWRNITEMYRNDRIRVTLGNNGDTTAYNIFTKQLEPPVNCFDGNTTYSPICGRYSPYNGVKYPVKCSFQCDLRKDCDCDSLIWGRNNWERDTFCDEYKASGACFNHGEIGERMNWVKATVYPAMETETGPYAYMSDASGFITGKDIESSAISTNMTCAGPSGSWSMEESKYKLPSGQVIKRSSVHPPEEVKYICDRFPQNFPSEYQNPSSSITQPPKSKFWCSASDACGILYRFDGNESPTSASTEGSNYKVANIRPLSKLIYQAPNYINQQLN
ncbi:hypothetical protein [Candidatus Trichorickettsia mobilis]|uniref:hypothetical protein n=1 Tax=Candidatus Trichorickettsia mobilis TaxID=1346319 RepID=UPI00292E9B6B|nr:hypothetical protein [Candidatus Trichorickettsia mobilis]